MPQQKVLTTCIFNGIDVSLANYADDILDISRTAFGIEENFGILDREYKRIGLRFNESKTEFLVFNHRSDCPTNVQLGEHVIKAQDTLTYLGVPIGSNLRATRQLLKDFFARKARNAYGLLVALKFKFNRRILASVYNAFAVPHLLALAPFWSLLTASDIRDIRKCFYKYAKYLLRLPLWTNNSSLSLRYGVASPVSAVQKRNERYRRQIIGESTSENVRR